MNKDQIKDFPISRHNRDIICWEFVEMFRGYYNDALKRTRELQGSSDNKWQYRIWDCR